MGLTEQVPAEVLLSPLQLLSRFISKNALRQALPMQHWNGLPRGCMANILLCKLTAARPITLCSEIACSARRVGRDRDAFTNETPAWSVSTLNASRSSISDFQWALLGMFQFCGNISLGFVCLQLQYVAFKIKAFIGFAPPD